MIGGRMTSAELVCSLQSLIDEALGAHVVAGARVAHVGYPNHWNTGDPAIWLGTEAALRRLGCHVVYQCAWQDYDRELMASQLGGGPILIAGGGNLGDLWPNHQLFRERILRDFPDNPVIQLPQSVCFEQPENLARFRRVCARHPDFQLMLRDWRSLKLAGESLDVPTSLCPDMAFGLGPLIPTCAPRSDIFWLSRTDKESLALDAPLLDGGIERRDWLERGADETGEDDDWESAGRLNQRIQRLHTDLRGQPEDATALLSGVSEAYESLAWIRVRRGLRMLSRGRVIITDRLHGHILGLCLGKPQVVMDNSYRKISSTRETWTAASVSTHWATTPTQALSHARALITGLDWLGWETPA